MSTRNKNITQQITCLFFTVVLAATLSTSVLANGYGNALKGVKSYNAVFEVSQGSPKIANLVFWAVKICLRGG